MANPERRLSRSETYRFQATGELPEWYQSAEAEKGGDLSDDPQSPQTEQTTQTTTVETAPAIEQQSETEATAAIEQKAAEIDSTAPAIVQLDSTTTESTEQSSEGGSNAAKATTKPPKK